MAIMLCCASCSAGMFRSTLERSDPGALYTAAKDGSAASCRSDPTARSKNSDSSTDELSDAVDRRWSSSLAARVDSLIDT